MGSKRRKPEGPPETRASRSIEALGASVFRRTREAQIARAICGALCAASVVLACAVERGRSLGDPEALLLAVLLAGLSLWAWLMAESTRPREVLTRVDERLHLGGALLAAHESCQESPESPIVQLGAVRVLQRVRPSQCIEAAVPHTLGFVAMPILGLLVLVQTVQSQDALRRSAGRVNVEIGSVAKDIGDLAGASELTADQKEHLEALRKKAAAAAKEAAEASMKGGDAPEKDWRSDLREVGDELAELAKEVPDGSKVAKELSDAAAEAEILAMDERGLAESPAKDSARDSGDGSSGEQEESSSAEAAAGDGRFAGDAEGEGGGAPPAQPLIAEDASLAQESETGSPKDGLPEEEAGEGAREAGLSGEALVQEAEPGEAGAPSENGAQGRSGEGETATASGADRGADRGAGRGASTQGRVLGGARPGDGAREEAGPSKDPEPERGARELFSGKRWWSNRDDAIVRSWLERTGGT